MPAASYSIYGGYGEKGRVTEYETHIAMRRQLAVKNGAAIACATRFGGDASMSTPAIPHSLGSLHTPAAAAAMRVVGHLWPRSFGYWDGLTHGDLITWFIRKVCFPFSISVTPRAAPLDDSFGRLVSRQAPALSGTDR